MMRFALLSVLAFALATPTLSHAKTMVDVTRKSKNLYKVDGQPFWIKTRYCYEYGYGEEAAIDNYEVVFLDSGSKCDIKAVMKEVDLQTGNYEVKVTREDDDLYSTLEGLYIQTAYCFEFGISEEAILRAGSYGSGSLIFVDSAKKCQIENVFRKVRI